MNRTNETALYAAADAAIARADAITFLAVGKPQTDAAFVAQWGADAEAAQACRLAAKVGPAWVRAHYHKEAEQFAAYA
jgi:hypothetical protein